MPFARPGVTTLRDEAVADIVLELGVPSLLRRSPLRALGYAQAGLAYHQYGYLDWVSRQSVPFTASGEYLEAWAALVGVLRVPAARAAGTVRFTGTPGVAVPQGTALRRKDGTTFLTFADLVLDVSGTGTVEAFALEPGVSGNTPDGAVLSLAAGIAGVQPGVAAAGPLSGGADIERNAPFRTRMLERYRAPPQGGAASDYRLWAGAVPGVTRVWVRPLGMGPGTVVVYVMLDLAQAANNGFPVGTDGVAGAEARDVAATGDQLRVADALHPLRPVTALVYVAAPAPAPVDFVFDVDTVVPLTVQASVSAALARVFVARASPLGTPIPLSAFVTAVAGVAGMPDFSLTAPDAAVLAPVGSLPVLGAVGYA